MEITQIDGETSVLEEALETPSAGDDSVVDGSSTVDESGGTDVESDVVSADVVQEESGDLMQEAGDETASDGLADESGEDEEADPEEVVEEVAIDMSSSPVFDSPLAVYLVDEPESSSAELYSVSGGVYPGTISTTYLDYFAGIVDKLGFNEHYVAFRSGQYEYYLVWGDGLEYDNSRFTGSALDYCRIYRNTGTDSNYYVERGSDTFSVVPGSGFVYSDLGNFASLTEGGTHLEFTTVLFAIGFAVVYSVCHDIFDYIMEHVYRK